MRTDNEQQAAATPGEWHADFHMGTWDVWQLPQQIAPIALGIDDEADAKLIALAPEMAAAVLDLAGIYETNVGDENAAWDELYRIADRLRKIGATS